MWSIGPSMNVLAVGAHPDDIELGCFGTLLEKRRSGANVYAVALAPGAYGQHSWEDVKAAWSLAREVLLRPKTGGGQAEYILGKFHTGSLEHSMETVGFVDSLITKYRINTVITHHYGEAHQDHIAAQKIAVSAARRRVDSLWLWESSIYTHRNILPFRAQLYVAISRDSYNGKMEALESYLASSLLESGEVDAHRHLAQYRGAEIHRGHAEAFEIVWQVHGDDVVRKQCTP